MGSRNTPKPQPQKKEKTPATVIEQEAAEPVPAPARGSGGVSSVDRSGRKNRRRGSLLTDPLLTGKTLLGL